MSQAGRHQARVAIEALRAGVPNEAAIRVLGSVESAIEARFVAGLEALQGARPHAGLVFAGGFGAGKSHLLGYLRDQALQRRMVVSRVNVSKETPLSQPGALFAAAMRGATAPGSPDDAVSVALAEMARRPAAVQELELWASRPESGVAPVFAAVAHLLARRLAPDLMHGIEAFLCGSKPPTAGVRRKLAELGARGMFELTGTKAAELDRQRPRFMAKLIRVAGFGGWCLLMDETELIGRYGPVQRATAYAELARWLGLAPSQGIPGLHVTAAITDDFADLVINDRQDDEKLPERLRNKGLLAEADLALGAMATIRAAPLLAAPAETDLARHAATLRGLYTIAYDWAAPAATQVERRTNRTMRHHVRGWMTEWDMLRLVGSRPGVDMSGMPADYSQNDDLVAPPADDDAGWGAAVRAGVAASVAGVSAGGDQAAGARLVAAGRRDGSGQDGPGDRGAAGAGRRRVAGDGGGPRGAGAAMAGAAAGLGAGVAAVDPCSGAPRSGWRRGGGLRTCI